MRLKHLLRPAILLAFAIIISRPIIAAWYANQAQIQALHGNPRPDLWQKVILLTSNPHWQQQWVLSLWQVGQVPRADDLLAYISSADQNPFADAFVFADLFAQQRDQEIVQRYRQVAQPVTPNACAAIVLAHLKTATTLSNAQIANLLACAFRKNSALAEFNLLPQTEFEKPQFWASDLGQRTITALTWQAQLLRSPTPHTPESAPVVSAQQIAALLKISPELVQLGPNLIKNGNFETLGCALPHITPSCAIANWQPSLMSTGAPWNIAVFVLGKENVSHTLSAASDVMRIDGLTIERLPPHEPARAGFSYFTPITLEPNHAYVLSLLYRVNAPKPDHAASFWLTGEPNIIHQHELFLPAISGWQRVTVIGWNRSHQPATIQPLLRLWTEGTVWFDDFAIYPILSDQPLPPRDTIIEIQSLN